MSTEDKQILDSLQPFNSHKLRTLLSHQFDFSQDTLNQALLASCHHGHKFLVQRLIGAGANIEHKDIEGNTPLLICASKGFSDIACFLLSRKADVKTVNSDGDNALILSITYSNIDLIQLLLEHKDIDLDLCNLQGYTAIMKAIKVKDIAIVKVLLKKYFCKTKMSEFCSGKKIVINISGETLEEFAAKSGLGNVINFLQEYVVKKSCPLKLAIDANDGQSLSVLLNCDFQSERKFERSVNEAFKHTFETNFQELGQNNNVQICLIEELLKHGADVNLPIVSKIKKSLPKMSHCSSEISTERRRFIMRASYSNRCSSALIEAAKHGYLDVVKLLVQYKAKVNMSHTHKENAADVAFTHGHLSCADFLVQHGAKITIEKALTFAIEEQNLTFVKFLERLCQPDFKMCIVKFANKLLRLAARGGDLDIIDVLILNEADINASDCSTLLPIVESKDGKMAEHLIQKGADVKVAKKSKHGQIPALSQMLHENFHLDSSKEEVVEVLLKHGAPVNKTSDCHDDETPIILAARMKNGVKIIQLLLEYGADISVCDNRGRTALMVAVKDDRHQTLQFLLETFKGSDLINKQDHRGMIALMYVVNDNNISAAAELLENGANINLRDHEGTSALLYAINSLANRGKEMVELLIKFGSNLNDQNSKGHTPLMLACKHGWKNVVQVLVDAGADVNAVNHIRKDQTAITYLTEFLDRKSNKLFCLEYLLDHGADSSFASKTYLQKVIIHGNLITIIPKLIQAGLGPIIPQPVKLRVNNFKLIQCQSPFAVALAAGNVQLARFLFGNMFLTQTDVSSLLSNRNKIDISETCTHDCQKFLDEVSSRPLSLLLLSFVTVTSAVGGSPGREKRIEALPLPRMMKNKLLFKDQAVFLESEPGGVTTATDIYYEESIYADDIDHWDRALNGSDDIFVDYSDYYVSSDSNSYFESDSD